MISVEFHCHSCYSQDSLLSLSRIIHTCKKKNLSKIAITDHNTINGALIAQKIAPELIIPGLEILTSEGELLAYFVNTDIPPGLSPEETISRLRDQNAYISISHPFDRYRKGAWKHSTLERIIPLVDGIEVFNSRCIQPGDNQKAEAYARNMTLIGMVGSDAHTAWEIGRSRMILPHFEDANSLKYSLLQAKQITGLSPSWIHLSSTFAKSIRKFVGKKAGNPSPP